MERQITCVFVFGNLFSFWVLLFTCRLSQLHLHSHCSEKKVLKVSALTSVCFAFQLVVKPRNVCPICEKTMRKKDCRRYLTLTETQRKEIAQASHEARSREAPATSAARQRLDEKRLAELVAEAVAKKMRSQNVD